MKIHLCLFLLSISILSQAQNTPKVLLIGMDGCRADALKVANTPNLDKVIAEGYSCMDMRTVLPTWSGPGWASMLTGVWYNKHRVIGNVFIGSKLNDYTHFFNFIEEQQPALKTVSVSHWEPINDKIIRKVDYQNSPKTDEKVAEEGAKILQEENPDIVFLHFDDIDHVGHFSGFGPQNKKYVAEIEKVDSLIGKVLNALTNRKNYAEEDWLVLFSTDHGGIGLMHGGGTQVERTSFVLAMGKNIKKQSPQPLVEEQVANKIAQFSKPQHKVILTPLGKSENEAWSFDLNFNIKNWQSDACLVDAPNLKIKTHPSDKHTWVASIGSSTIKIQGDTVSDKAWHHVQITCTKEGLVKVFQNGKIIGLEQSTMPISNILNDSLTINYCKQKTKKTLIWELHDCKIQKGISSNPHQQKWLDDENKTAENNSLVFDWQDETMSKNAQVHVPIAHKKETIQFKKYNYFPKIVDIVPTILEHLKMKITDEQKSNYFDGQPIIWE